MRSGEKRSLAGDVPTGVLRHTGGYIACSLCSSRPIVSVFVLGLFPLLFSTPAF